MRLQLDRARDSRKLFTDERGAWHEYQKGNRIGSGVAEAGATAELFEQERIAGIVRRRHGAGLAGCKDEAGAVKPAAAAGGPAIGHEIAPGQLDDYYAFTSGGHSGEGRILGIPSGRTIKRIPVFNIDPMVGWGITNESKAVIGTCPDGSLNYITGDTHHMHGGSYKDGSSTPGSRAC